jgi:hypothetical protein
LGGHGIHLAVKQKPQHASEKDGHAEKQKDRRGEMLGESRAEDYGARGRGKQETACGAEDPYGKKRAENAVFGCVRTTGQQKQYRQR